MVPSTRPRISWFTLIGVIAAAFITVMLIVLVLYEPVRAHYAQEDQQRFALNRATQLYGIHCVSCHGAFGEGLTQNGALNTFAIRTKDDADLYKSIERGIPNTTMAGYGKSIGGPLSSQQVSDLV